jgi:hypothetical protein
MCLERLRRPSRVTLAHRSAQVADDLEEPALETVGLTASPQVSKRTHEPVLNHIVGLRFVESHVPDISQQAALMSVHEDPEGVAISR